MIAIQKFEVNLENGLTKMRRVSQNEFPEPKYDLKSSLIGKFLKFLYSL